MAWGEFADEGIDVGDISSPGSGYRRLSRPRSMNTYYALLQNEKDSLARGDKKTLWVAGTHSSTNLRVAIPAQTKQNSLENPVWINLV